MTSHLVQNNLKHAIPALAGNVSSAVLIKFIQLQKVEIQL